MANTKVIGYILSLAGLAMIALSSQISKLSFLASNTRAMAIPIVGGIVLITVGIVLIISEGSSSKVKHAAEEVPIYSGEGKKKRIIGYKKVEE